MKKQLYNFIMLLCFAAFAVSCGKDGDVGPQGAQGTEGVKGDKGGVAFRFCTRNTTNKFTKY